ncbi:amino acid adenylation domain-containing protein [Oscillospiraceae bacterium NSJ-54]|uniref:Amino acid adenylation domain-containing protein n=2 Tax=Zongyangia hominis TaxID=2763677 RepID=A0A926IAK1_9FIRM|nr:amino acid adenylation domain-containing protein [Zongyangia hominis]
MSQRNIWDLECAYPETSMNNISTTIRIEGRVDFVVLQKSIQLALQRDPSLRTRLFVRDGEPMQYHAPFEAESFPVYDFSRTSAEGIENWENAVTRELIPLTGGPLYRFVLFRRGEHEGGLLIKIHHIISDGWSQVLLCNRIAQTYLELLSGNEPTIEESPSYRLHVEEEQSYLASGAYRRDLAYWEGMTKEAGEPSVIKSVPSAAVSPVGYRASFQLPEVLNHAIYSFCLQNRVAPFAVFYMALAIYFKRIGGADRFTIGVPIFNRTSFLMKQMTGMFVSTLPFFNDISEEWSLAQFNERLAESWYELLRHQRFPFSHISRLMEEQGRLFDIVLSYQDSKIYESKDASVLFSGRWHYSGYQAEQLCIHLSNMENHRRYAVDYDYLTQFFSRQEIEGLHHRLMNILSEALALPDKPLRSLSVLSAQELEQVVYGFNQTARPVHEKSLAGRFAQVVREHPARAAVICGGVRTTYGELDGTARRVCAAIRQSAAAKNGLAAVLLPRECALFAALAGIMEAGWAHLLLSPDLPSKRIEELIIQSGAEVLITEERVLRQCGALSTGMPVVEMDHLPEAGEEPVEEGDPNALAYVVYTSGSTGTPKGVEISQGSLLNLVTAMEGVYGKGAVLSVCSIGFDAFLLESAVALLNARTIVLPSDEDLESPAALAGLITGYAVGFLSLTPSRLSAFLKNSAFLSAMRGMESVVCGGEPFPGELLGRLQASSNARIYNQYGPSETTVGVSLKLLNRAPAITAGAPMQNCRLYVLDRWMNPLPVGVAGDLYIGGVCVGKGYRAAPELTEASFLPSPFEAGERIYRTGDTALWNEAGEIVLAGRSDRQVKLRGVRIEPQEIAAALQSHPLVRAAAVRVWKEETGSFLAAYYTAERELPEGEVLSFLADFLPRTMLPSFAVYLERLPMTPNGKVDESGLPFPNAMDGGPEAPQNTWEELVLDVFRRVLERPDMAVEGDYFLHGGNSLNAMEVIGEIEERCGRRLRVAELYACRTARRLAEHLAPQAAAPSLPRLLPAPEMEDYPLSPMQESLYVQSHLDPTGLAYHMAGAFRLWSSPDLPRLEEAFRKLIEENKLLRTQFVQGPGGVSARVRESAPFSLPVLTGADFEEVCGQFLRPFDLSKAPLLRAAVWEEAEDRWVLLLDTHHMIGDGLGTPVVMERLDALYRGLSPEAPSLTYLDYAYDISKRGGGEGEDLSYWKSLLTPLPEPLELPTDFPRPHIFDFRGDICRFALSAELSRACDGLCEKAGVSSFVLFAAAIGILLMHISGKEDFVLGVPVSRRQRPELKKMLGPLIGTLPLRLSPRRKEGVRAYLDRLRETVAEMLDHQETTLEEILSQLALPRSLSQTPLYQVMFSQRPVEQNAFTLDGERMDYLPIPTKTAKMDLNFEAGREGDHYEFSLEYASSLFTGDTARFYTRCLEAVLRSLTENPEQKVGEVCALSVRDRIALIDTPNHLFTPYLNQPIQGLCGNEIALHPDAPAVIFHGRVTTYRQLGERANQMAHALTRAGAKPGDCVGLALRRTPDLIAGMLGILKAGCAYVPLLSSFPEERLRSMMETGRVHLCLCDKETASILPEALPCQKVVAQDNLPTRFLDVPVKGGDIIHVLFTSGSTGSPKGVMLKHSSISNLFEVMRRMMDPVEGPLLCTTNLIFDTFISETLYPLAMGKTIVLADEEEMLLPFQMARLMEETGVEMMQFTPSRLQMCMASDDFRRAAGRLKFTIVCGEVLPPALVEQFKAVCPGRLVTMYGPTEVTVYMTTTEVFPGEPITLGRPMQNCRVYVLDEERRPVLPTAAGEIYVAGECVSAGYISRPDLTEKTFLPDPFFPGEIMYQTGDRGRLRLDGSYDFLGRKDAQVKLNGQRVELDEITGAILATGLAEQAATLPLSGPGGSMELCAFYLPRQGREAGPKELRACLAKTLPAYMIPSSLRPLAQMPYTPTGKIDRQTLLAMAREGGTAPGSGESPLPAAEEVSDAASPRLTWREVPEKEATSGPIPSWQPEEMAAETSDLADLSSIRLGVGTGAKEIKAPAPPTVSGPPASAPKDAAESERPPASRTVETAQALTRGSASAPDFFGCETSAPSRAAASQTCAKVPAEHLLPPDEKLAAAPPTAVTGYDILTIWKGILGRDNLSPERSFFEQGGTSLAALNALSQYYNHRWEMSLAQFYEHPTACAQAQLLSPQGEGENTAAYREEIPLPRKVPLLPYHPLRPSRTVLLTGGTGFFGVHLLRSLLDAGVSLIVCLTRDGEKRRLVDVLAWYFGSGWAASAAGRIETMAGDVREERLGLSEEAYRDLAEKIDAIYHCAADVRHYMAAEEEALETNITGTQVALDLARRTGVPLHYMSTTSISGEYLTEAPEKAVEFTENDFAIGQNWRENVYLRTKFLAEAKVIQAIGEGVQARIYRLGRLVGRMSDGVFQRNPEQNAFYLLLRGLGALGVLPQSLAGAPVDLTPVDYAADAVAALGKAPLSVYHITHPAPPNMGEVAAAVFPGIQTVSDEAFESFLSRIPPGKEEAVGPLLDFWNHVKKHPPQIRLSSAQTLEQLQKLGFDRRMPPPSRLLCGLHFDS